MKRARADSLRGGEKGGLNLRTDLRSIKPAKYRRLTPITAARQPATLRRVASRAVIATFANPTCASANVAGRRCSTPK